MSIKEERKSIYSKDKLSKLYVVDLFSAATSASMVAPFITVVDRSIIENLNGKRQLLAGLKYGFHSFLTKPLQFVGSPQFRIVVGLYTSTYATANIVDTTCEQYSVESTTASMYKFISTSLVNILLSVYKDRVFTSMFGVASNRAFPKLSYLLFTARDSLTIAASFTAPAYIADFLQKKEIVSAEKPAKFAAQLVSPCAVQFLSTPVHLFALDLYNRPNIASIARFQLIRKEYLKSALARIGRIGPAFGFGGVGNTYLRSFRNKI